MYNIINIKTIHYKLTATGNIIHSILNYKSGQQFTALTTEQKKSANIANSRKKMREKSFEGNKNELFSKKNSSIFKKFINSHEILF